MNKAREKDNEAETSHFLGVDFGAAKIGLAKADSETKIAFQYGTLSNNTDTLKKLKEICEKEEISKIIIGVPNHESQKSGQLKAEEFGNNVKKILPDVEIFYHDEMFTTKMAQDNLKEAGKSNVGQIDDAESARIILTSWIEKNM